MKFDDLDELTEDELWEFFENSESMVVNTIEYMVYEDRKNVTQHVLPDQSSFFVFNKDGYIEVHHATKDNVSGLKSQLGNPMNLMWVVNAYHIIKPFLDSGNMVKLTATNDIQNEHKSSMFMSILKIVHYAALSRHYSVSTPTYEIDSHGRSMGTIILALGTGGAIGEAQRIIVKSMTPQNNYTGIPMGHALHRYLNQLTN